MVLENLAVPERMECHPSRMAIVGFIYATVGLLLGMLVFGDYASISAIFLTTMPLIVVMFKAIRHEECKDMKIQREMLLIKEHMKLVLLFVYLFLGLFLAYSTWFALLPEVMVKDIFSTQIDTINAVRSSFTADVTGHAVGQTTELGVVFFRNLSVLGFCVLFSFLYGAGAIYILTWNASVIGVAAGQLIREALNKLAGISGLGVFGDYFVIMPISMGYLLHGIPEVTAYFIAALGGGIISEAVANHYGSKEFNHIVFDSIDLVALSVLVLFAAAFIEVYVTPILF